MAAAVAAILLFAGASFFFALAETALFSLSNWQVRQLAEKYPRAGKVVGELLERPDDLLATLALGNTFANAAVIAAALWLIFDARRPFFLTLAVLVVLVLIGCEVFPKTLAVRRPERWALRAVWPLLLFQKSTSPLHQAAQWMDSLFLKRMSRAGPAALPDAEYQELLEMAFQQGTLGESEKEIILQIISLDKRTAGDVMRPRAAMACVSDDATVEEMIAAAKKFKHRRLPIYDETPDTIVGILNTRALLFDPGADLSEAIEFPSFVPETMNLLRLFQSLQQQRRGMAVVLDEFGGVAGIVTMEDILALLVGRIHAAPQAEGFVMEKLGPAQWRVNGSMRLEDFRREYPALGEVAEVETMGGLLAHLLGVIPENGESATYRNLKLTARAVDDRRVRELMVQRLK
ncbi:MAG TPA: hemolysin family protein [Alphaproteobacteria bacterium]|nr:hemolysin family protein [Alphaproteobacteria bacterium]